MNNLNEDLTRAQNELKKTRDAIWDMLNYANMFVLVLDENMIIKFINCSLATALGFKTEFEAVGMCWLDFIQEEDRKIISTIHKSISNNSENSKVFQEHENVVLDINGNPITIKWFNMQINHEYAWSFSIGLIPERSSFMSEDAIRAYYQDIIKKDRTMIKAVRESILNTDRSDTCEPQS